MDNFPLLFQEIGSMANKDQKYSYVREELIRMALDGTLVLTHLFAQGPEIRDLCGEVILGHYNGPQGTEFVDPVDELRDLTFRIRSIVPGWNVSFKSGWRKVNPARPGRFLTPQEHKLLGPNKVKSNASLNEPVIKNTGKTDVRLGIRDAWLCLRKHGKNCAVVTGGAMAKSVWKCEEVWGEPEPAKPKKKTYKKKAQGASTLSAAG